MYKVSFRQSMYGFLYGCYEGVDKGSVGLILWFSMYRVWGCRFRVRLSVFGSGFYWWLMVQEG